MPHPTYTILRFQLMDGDHCLNITLKPTAARLVLLFFITTITIKCISCHTMAQDVFWFYQGQNFHQLFLSLTCSVCHRLGLMAIHRNGHKFLQLLFWETLNIRVRKIN